MSPAKRDGFRLILAVVGLLLLAWILLSIFFYAVSQVLPVVRAEAISFIHDATAVQSRDGGQ